MSLTELLIVVAVMVILLGLGLPMVKTGLEGRRIREASRQLNTYVELAKSQAAETGRPAGLILDVETLPGNGLPEDYLPYVSQVFLAQTPPPYVGDMVTARVRVAYNSSAYVPTMVSTYPRIAAFTDSGSFSSLLRPGDQIKFDYRGSLYTLYFDNTTSVWHFNLYPSPQTLANVPLPPTGVALPYQVFRQPEKSGSMPMEMAPGAVIDLSMSGFGLSDEFRFDNDIVIGNPNTLVKEIQFVSIVFGPSGGVTRVLVNKYNHNTNQTEIDTHMPTATLHLLVGKIDGVLLDDIANVNTADDLETNIENSESLWVSIGHQAGRVTTAENGWTDPVPPLAPPPALTAAAAAALMATAREFAQSGKAMGGR